MMPYIWKDAFGIGWIDIHSYGAMAVVALLMANWLIGRESRRVGYDVDRMFNLTILMFLVGLVGARLLHIAVYWDQFRDAPFGKVFRLWEGGLVWYGGVLAAAPFAMWYIGRNRKGLALWGAIDILYIGCVFGLAFARWGCLFAGCCYGQPCDLPWAVTYTHPDSVVVGALGEGNATNLHPTPIYASIMSFAIVAILLWVQRRKRFDGQIFALGLVLYAIGRYGLEFVRGDMKRGFVEFWDGFSVSTSQLIGIGTVAFAVLLWVVLGRRQARQVAADAEAAEK